MNFEEAMSRAGRDWYIYFNKGLTVIYSKDGLNKLHVPTDRVTIQDLRNLQSELRNDLINRNFSSSTEASYIGEQYALCCELLDDLLPYIETQFTFYEVSNVEVGYEQYQPCLVFTCSETAFDILRKSENEASSYGRLANALSAEMREIALEAAEKRK